MAEGEAFEYLETVGIPEMVRILIEAEALARTEGYATIANGAHEVTLGLLDEVNLVATEIAGLADGAIVSKMLETHNRVQRPATGDMESHIRSEAGPLGLVRVALVDELNRIVNPNGYGPYWRAQEYGTGVEGVPSQVGRRLVGTFDPSGTPPDAGQRGLGQGRDIAFIPGGANPGLGVLSVDLPGRHFLRDGAAEAANEYQRRMQEVQARWSRKLEELIALLARERGGRNFLGIIEA